MKYVRSRAVIFFSVVKHHERAVVFKRAKIIAAQCEALVAELGAFLQRESKAVGEIAATSDQPNRCTNGQLGGRVAAQASARTATPTTALS
jgi:hypothetical protein